jgi:hypothetical protein
VAEDGVGAGECVDPKWESSFGHAHASARYFAMTRPSPSPMPGPELDPRIDLAVRVEPVIDPAGPAARGGDAALLQTVLGSGASKPAPAFCAREAVRETLSVVYCCGLTPLVSAAPASRGGAHEPCWNARSGGTPDRLASGIPEGSGQCGTYVGGRSSAAEKSELERCQVDGDVLPPHDERRRRARRVVTREVDHDVMTSQRKTS